jgi:hypothetical protein
MIIASTATSTMTAGGSSVLTSTTANLTVPDDNVISVYVISCGINAAGLKVSIYYTYA